MRKLCCKIICAGLCAAAVLGSFCVGRVSGAASFDSYNTYGFRPSLPVSDEILTVTSADYYYENKNDSLPGLHGGIDILVPSKTEVLAVGDGEVTYTGSNSGYGYNMIVRHEAEGRVFYSRYAHLSSYEASVGELVSQGEKIALSGNSGTYTAHLHLEIYEHNSPARLERAYTLKYYLAQGVDMLSHFEFYTQFISGEYNSQTRVKILGSGGSCYSRCERSDSHDHISVFANYIKKFFVISGDRYIFDSTAEERLFADSAVRGRVYEKYDADRDGHLSYEEAMSVTSLDLIDLIYDSQDGCDIFENLTSVLTDPVYTLKVKYVVSEGFATDGGLCGTWKHTDTKSNLNMRSGPSTSYDKVGKVPPEAVFRVTETAEADGYLWGKTEYNGILGWCALDESWAEQLSSTELDFYIDGEGILRNTATTEPYINSINSNRTTAILVSPDAFGFLPEGKMLVGWATEPDGEPVRVSSDISILALCPELSESDAELTLYAVIRDSNVEGDCDGDGVLGEGDIEMLVRYISGYRDPFLRPDFLDYNGDGKINNRDIIAIERKLANMPPVS